ncbi:MAG: hypothetical protein WEC84_04065 [Candidatus Andersenbacteria bacterium]
MTRAIAKTLERLTTGRKSKAQSLEARTDAVRKRLSQAEKKKWNSTKVLRAIRNGK